MSGKDTQHPTLPPASDLEVERPQDSENTEDTPPKSRFRRFLVPGLIGLAILGGVGWIVFSRVIMPLIIFSQMKPQPTPVQLGSPKSAPIDDSSDYAASLDSRQSITLQPRVAGQVSAIYVRAGDRVEAGQQILQIDSDAQRAQVASRTAAADTAAAEVDSARADVDNAIDNLKALQARRASAQANVQLNQREYERYQELYKQGAESRQTLDQRLNAIQTAQAALQQADADIRAQQSTIARARSQVVRNQRALQQAQATVNEGAAELGFYSITAPFTGIVGNIPVKVGDFVDTSTQLLNLTQNRQLEIQIQIPLERASQLRRGLPVKLLDQQDKVLQSGQISFIAPNVDPSTQSVQVKAIFPNVGNQLRSSQFIRARVIWNTRPGVLVPTSAISRLGGKNFIFVAAPFKDSGCKEPAKSEFGGPVKVEPDQLTAAQKPIQLGKIVGNDQEVLEGLSGRDRIVTSGILQLQNCAPIAEAK
ncbi:efflux RND transporter periplasmic adaptor subunit [Kovacikia minuta CCNUW1]|uniref:efflux RND transporter periplasmic adaptor subunit n=1 Tax=Kovacikia minuta TaxID=2931930 RepID=UPI001CCEBA80|nr:efflux RND transporter periplasmic adaptor subunit [Kovacikia minuta]UBF27118.1 efflux RND transporter periplasmic adaptor subunit [Kovacikia minuta CCNUW1]